MVSRTDFRSSTLRSLPQLSSAEVVRTPIASSDRPIAPGEFPSNGRIPNTERPARSRAVEIPRGSSRLDSELYQLANWCDRILQHHPDRFFTPKIRSIVHPSEEECREIEETVRFFKSQIGRALWVGFECSHPLVGSDRNECFKKRRWDQNALADLYDRASRHHQLFALESLGIENVRLGIPYPQMVRAPGASSGSFLDRSLNKLAARASSMGLCRYDWSIFDEVYSDFMAHPCNIAIDFTHFGVPDFFHDDEAPLKSGFSHPLWPRQFAHFVDAAIRRYPGFKLVTLINEPLVTNLFSGWHWNERGSGDTAFVRRALNIARGAILARTKIEEHLQATGRRLLFLHNESCEYTANDDGFNQYKRFLTSDLILGADWLFSYDLRNEPMVRWMIEKMGTDQGAQKNLIAELRGIRSQHEAFRARFGKSMKADTVFGIDYYITCERGPGISHDFRRYRFEAQRTRRGFYDLGIEYFNRYRLPMLHTETNAVESHAVEWFTQKLIDATHLLRTTSTTYGARQRHQPASSRAAVLANTQKDDSQTSVETFRFPFLGVTWYSLLDQVGWESALSEPVIHNVKQARSLGRINPIGAFQLESFRPRRIARLLAHLSDALDGAAG